MGWWGMILAAGQERFSKQAPCPGSDISSFQVCKEFEEDVHQLFPNLKKTKLEQFNYLFFF